MTAANSLYLFDPERMALNRQQTQPTLMAWYTWYPIEGIEENKNTIGERVGL